MKRIPVKKTSIKHRQDIIEKGFELICEKGYYNVTSVDIAKYAGVSTGVVYQYFDDKEDVFIQGVKDYADKIIFPISEIIKKINNKNNIKEIISEIIDSYINNHKITKKSHAELMAMSWLNDKIFEIFINKEIEMTKELAKVLEKNGFNIDNIDEKVHVIYALIDSFCHEVVYHKHDKLNYKIMKDNIIDLILYNLNN